MVAMHSGHGSTQISCQLVSPGRTKLCFSKQRSFKGLTTTGTTLTAKTFPQSSTSKRLKCCVRRELTIKRTMIWN